MAVILVGLHCCYSGRFALLSFSYVCMTAIHYFLSDANIIY